MLIALDPWYIPSEMSERKGYRMPGVNSEQDPSKAWESVKSSLSIIEMWPIQFLLQARLRTEDI